MEWMAETVGWRSRRRDWPFRDLYAPQPTSGEGGPLSRHRNGSFFCRAVRGRRGVPAFITPRRSRLGADPSISRVMLRASRAVRRSPGDRYALADVDDRGGAECHALAEPRAPRALPLRSALGSRRGDASKTGRRATSLVINGQ